MNNSTAATHLANTLIASSSTVDNCVDVNNLITDSGYNLSSDSTCNLTPDTSLPNTNPNLGPLASNGGPTQTHALLASSPAIDKILQGTNGCGTTITADQRGIARPQPQGGACDIGAYEVEVVRDNQPPVVSNVTANPNPVLANANTTLSATVDDSTTGNSNIASAEYNVDGGTIWTAMSATDGAFNSPTEQVSATLTFSQLGVHTVCVRGTDVFSNTSAQECTTVTVEAGSTLHVGSINGAVTFAKNRYTLSATVLVVDTNRAPVSGVTVNTKITAADGTVSTPSAKTDKSGAASFSASSKTNTSWQVCVTNLTKSKYTYDSAANVETCDSFGL